MFKSAQLDWSFVFFTKVGSTCIHQITGCHMKTIVHVPLHVCMCVCVGVDVHAYIYVRNRPFILSYPILHILSCSWAATLQVTIYIVLTGCLQ